ncbi:EAL domain-containing protein [Paenibacillus septentrionalis]|uniref:EAL domain-containing protein n=1 Tax=Paenibacillus septentrionalis TaxID=429342 RepID=A0ABW1V1R8_9BACL
MEHHHLEHMHGSYDWALVAFSYIVAVLSSYTVLEFTGLNIRAGKRRWNWLLCGAAALGMGVWSMHFVGMLAFSLPVPILYDLNKVIISVVAVIAASFAALYIIARERLSHWQLLGSAMLLAIGISAMHYIGMEAIELQITYKPVYVILSIVIALLASYAALWLTIYFREENGRGHNWKKLLSGLVMGTAVAGMHYTGMVAAEFQMDSELLLKEGDLDPKQLAYLIAVGTLLTLGVSLVINYYSRRFMRQEKVIQEGESWYKSLFMNNHDAIFAVGDDYRIKSFNAAACELTGLSEDELENISTDQLISLVTEDSRQNIRKLFGNSLSAELQQYEVTIRHREGHLVNLSIKNIPVDIHGKVVGSYIIARDVTEEKRTKEHIQHLALHDELTDLPNRRQFKQLLANQIERAGNEQFAVMLLDIDRFKMINDSLGHTFGDLFLKEMGQRISKAIQHNGVTLARLGGDEFTLLTNYGMTESEIVYMAQHIIRAISLPYRINDSEFYVTASIGIALFPMDGVDGNQLLQNADTAMYEVKKNGKNGYQFFSSVLNEQLQEKIEMEADLRKAIDEKQFILHYQPQIRTEDSQMIGVEALVRWKHPTKGMISPGLFIPLAEETGLIYSLGTYVLKEACRQMKEWHEEGGPLIPISVNLSSQQFHQSNLVQVINDILEKTGLAPQYLELEITESMMMDAEISGSILNDLKELGVRISLDDFGTGYSSLSYLKLLPIHKLKIDRSFIQDITSNTNDRAIVATIIAMAQHLHMDVVAEGIETREQLDILTENDCHKIQGYYFSKPLPAEEVEKAFFVPNRVLK